MPPRLRFTVKSSKMMNKLVVVEKTDDNILKQPIVTITASCCDCMFVHSVAGKFELKMNK